MTEPTLKNRPKIPTRPKIPDRIKHSIQCLEWFEGFEKKIRKTIAYSDDPKSLIIRNGETFINTKEILGK